MKNWKTTLMAFLTMFGVVSMELQALLDNDPTTVLDLNVIVGAVGTFIAFTLAKDSDKDVVEE